jgi:hypothetical protein
MVCVHCALRFRPSVLCPADGGNRVLDLARPQGREAAWAAMRRRFRPIEPQPPPGAIDPDLPRVKVSGIVRVAAPVRSPLRKLPCALFTIEGATPGSVMRDAGGAPSGFDVIADDGSVAHVELADATVRPLLRAKTISPADHVPFLEERGAYLAEWHGDWPLTETILADGDAVTIEGNAEARPAPALYREAKFTLVFRDVWMSPLVIAAIS